MFSLHKRLPALALILVLLAGLLPYPVFAADLISVTPTTVVNNIDNTLTVTGTGFDNTAVVLLNGSALSTTFYNDQTLTAVVPAGYSPNTYAVTITISGGPVNIPVPISLTINAPTPTATPSVTPTALPFSRPQMRVTFSGANTKQVSTDDRFKFTVNFENAGNMTAFNTQATFTSADLVPLET
ncbi:MAG TPA: IPT/TIG domain-containing protein, partial [Anaerolineales bacterium]|nr:IPT/TIG domain-containing protein [Anaerolineales bacterium]